MQSLFLLEVDEFEFGKLHVDLSEGYVWWVILNEGGSLESGSEVLGPSASGGGVV